MGLKNISFFLDLKKPTKISIDYKLFFFYENGIWHQQEKVMNTGNNEMVQI